MSNSAPTWKAVGHFDDGSTSSIEVSIYEFHGAKHLDIRREDGDPGPSVLDERHLASLISRLLEAGAIAGYDIDAVRREVGLAESLHAPHVHKVVYEAECEVFPGLFSRLRVLSCASAGNDQEATYRVELVSENEGVEYTLSTQAMNSLCEFLKDFQNRRFLNLINEGVPLSFGCGSLSEKNLVGVRVYGGVSPDTTYDDDVFSVFLTEQDASSLARELEHIAAPVPTRGHHNC